VVARRAVELIRAAWVKAALLGSAAETILRFSAEMDVLRVAVNVGCSTGASGFDTWLAPTMTVGTGFFGRSSVSENIGPQHFVQWTKIAYNKAADIPFGDFSGLSLPEPATRPRLPEGKSDYSFNWVGGRPSRPGNASPVAAGVVDSDDIRAEIRTLIQEELRALQREAH
jgi:hypothetical protein